MTPRIVPLPTHVVGQIAAGEVVERPGSVCKELIENALDARARSVTIDVEEGGRDLLRVTDDGVGIAKEDLPLALASHATSKIRSADDLFHVRTMGFRGEALASIASVSDFRLRSRPADQPHAAKIEARDGRVGEVTDCAGPFGTEVEVRQLFSSVPVRRKFLKSKQTELGHITESLIRVALAHPGISFELKHNGRSIHQRPADMDLPAAVDQFFGPEIARSLIPIHSESDGITVEGFVADPSVSRPTQRLQYLFVNGRFIRDRSLGHAIQEAYRGLLLTGRYPVAFLFLTVPCDQVDVNVHPTKIEVRFEEPRRLYSQILATIRERFLRADLVARWQPIREKRSEELPTSARGTLNQEFALATPSSDLQPSLWSAASSPTRQDREESTTVPSPPRPRAPLVPAAREMPSPAAREAFFAATREAFAPLPTSTPAERSVKIDREEEASAAEQDVIRRADPPQPAGLTERVRAIQLHNSYLVIETDEGMLLVDQHALHERILYESLRQRVAARGVEVQELLVPEPVELTPTQAGLLIEQQETLAELGVLVEEFGDRCVLVRGYPALLRRVRPAELVREIACRLEETGKVPSRDQLLEDLLNMVACKAAIKAGDPLTPEEMESLVRQRNLVEDSHHCPHGRPTVLRFTLGDLEKQFQRK